MSKFKELLVFQIAFEQATEVFKISNQLAKVFLNTNLFVRYNPPNNKVLKKKVP